MKLLDQSYNKYNVERIGWNQTTNFIVHFFNAYKMLDIDLLPGTESLERTNCWLALMID